MGARAVVIVLVTGGLGFIGRHVVAQLQGAGHQTVVLDSPNDVCDHATVDRLAEGVGCIVHLAAQVSVQESFTDPERTYHVNLGGTLNVLKAARRVGARVVLASSAAAVDYASPYAASKACAEVTANTWSRCYGVPVVVLRYFNIYGPGQTAEVVVPRFCRAALAGDRPTIYGTGVQVRDFCYVEDAARATALACVSGSVVGQTIDIGSGVETSILDLWCTVAALTLSSQDPVYDTARAGDALRSVADTACMRRDLGCNSRNLAEGLRMTLDWMRAHA